MPEKRLDLRGPELARMAFAMKQNESPYPSHIGPLRRHAAVPKPKLISQLLEERAPLGAVGGRIGVGVGTNSGLAMEPDV
jgi:hypothetical protein